MKFWLRWTADSVAFFLSLYLVDSVLSGRFRIHEVWVAIVLALALGLLNSLIRPLRRWKTRPLWATATAVSTVLLNALVLQIVLWAGGPLSANSFVWVLAVALLLSVLAGAINSLIGFSSKEKVRPAGRERAETRPLGTREKRTPRS